VVDIYDDGRPADHDANIKPVKRSRQEIERAVAVAIEGFSKDGQDLSKVTASGYGALAEQILALAFQNGVKVREDRDLAQMLAMVELDSEIPTEALVAVAEILSYVYRLNGQYKKTESLKDDLG